MTPWHSLNNRIPLANGVPPKGVLENTLYLCKYFATYQTPKGATPPYRRGVFAVDELNRSREWKSKGFYLRRNAIYDWVIAVPRNPADWLCGKTQTPEGNLMVPENEEPFIPALIDLQFWTGRGDAIRPRVRLGKYVPTRREWYIVEDHLTAMGEMVRGKFWVAHEAVLHLPLPKIEGGV